MTTEERRRHFDNGLAGLINALSNVKNNKSYTDEDKLKMVCSIEKTFPALKSALIFFMNTNKEGKA